MTHQSDSKLCNQLEKDCWYLTKKTRPLFLHFVHLGIFWSANLRACKSNTAGIRVTHLSVWLLAQAVVSKGYWPYLAYLPGKPFPTSRVLQIMLRPRHLPNSPITSPSHTDPNWSIYSTWYSNLHYQKKNPKPLKRHSSIILTLAYLHIKRNSSKPRTQCFVASTAPNLEFLELRFWCSRTLSHQAPPERTWVKQQGIPVPWSVGKSGEVCTAFVVKPQNLTHIFCKKIEA